MAEGTVVNAGTGPDQIDDIDTTGQPRLGGMVPSVPVLQGTATASKLERTRIAAASPEPDIDAGDASFDNPAGVHDAWTANILRQLLLAVAGPDGFAPDGQESGNDAAIPTLVDLLQELIDTLQSTRLAGATTGTQLTNAAAIASTQLVTVSPVNPVLVEGNDAVGVTPVSNPPVAGYIDLNGLVRYSTYNTVAGGGFGGPTNYDNVCTDLEGYRDDFQETSLTQNFTGTCTFSKGSNIVTGNGTSFISQCSTCDIYVKLSTDPDSDYVKLLVQPYYDGPSGNNFRLLLSAPYQGSTGTGTGTFTFWADTIGAGGSINVGSGAVAASQVGLLTGTTSGSYTYIQHGVHYTAPMSITVYASVSQAIVNQEFAIGIVDNITAPATQILLIFNGTVNTQVTLRTGNTNGTVENSLVTLPNSLTTATQVRYKIVCSVNAVVLYANDIPIARNHLHLPNFYTPQPLTMAAYNTGAPAGTSTLIVDMIHITSQDIIETESATTANPAPAITSGFDASGGYQQAAMTAPSTAATAVQAAAIVALSPNSHVKATDQPLYGSNNQALTITLASLATGGARASTAISNTSSLADDALIFVKITSNVTSGTLATGYVNIYGYGSVDGGATYSESITGTDAGVTLTVPPNLGPVQQMNVVANNVTYRFGPFSFCRTFGFDRLPAEWGIVIVNQSGAALSATGANQAVTYQLVNGQLT